MRAPGTSADVVWADRIEGWPGDGDVPAYYDNDREGHAIRNATRLQELLGVRPCAHVATLA